MGASVPRTSYLFTSESVSEGHPDKVCDRISDEIVDLFYREGAKAGMDLWKIRAACETLATTNQIVLRSERGYTSIEPNDRMLQNREFVDAKVDIFGRTGSSRWIKMGEFQIDRTLVNN